MAISSGLFSLQEEYFYLSPVRMESFKQFQQAIMNATYQEHQSDDRLVNRVRERFEGFILSVKLGQTFSVRSSRLFISGL